MRLLVNPEVTALGIDVCMALVKGAGVSNKSNPLEKKKKAVIGELQPQVDSMLGHPILQEYRHLHQLAGLAEGVPPAQHLLTLIQRNGRLPNINTVVDCYNLVSVQTLLSVGAHDTAHIRGDVQFVVTDGREKYTPLGESEALKVSAGEYACMDKEKILCRMDLKQCAETRITKDTTEFIVYVQGNRLTEYSYLTEALHNICKLITEICGGEYEVINREAFCKDSPGNDRA
jgi:DNA/RNA-binding domain of Phe-tRNA-synthetase-like protein